MKKPVWRMNTGNGVPSDLGDKVFISDFVGFRGSSDLRDYDGYWLIRDDMNIDFYQTNRTKAAKFERVECEDCIGTGNATDLDCGEVVFYLGEKCPDCQGRGYIWKTGEER